MTEQHQSFECVEQPTFFVSTLKCNKCNCFSNINLDPLLSSYEFEKIQNSYLCFYCSNNVNDFQHIMKYINTQISNIIHLNSTSFRKTYNKIEMLMSICDDNKQIHNYQFIELKKSFDSLKIEYNTINIKFKERFDLLQVDYDKKTESMELLEKDIHYIKEYKSHYDKQLIELKSHIEMLKKEMNCEMFEKKWSILSKHTKQLHYIENRITNLNNHILNDEKKYECDYTSLNKKLNEIIMKNQEYKELKQLKKELMINKKEYNKFKEKINLFYDYLFFIFLLVGVNVVFILLFIYDKFYS